SAHTGGGARRHAVQHQGHLLGEAGVAMEIPEALLEQPLRALVPRLHRVGVEIEPGRAHGRVEGLETEPPLRREIVRLIVREGLPEVERDRPDHSCRSSAAMASGSAPRSSITRSGSGGPAAPPAATTCTTRSPALRAPSTSSRESSPTCAASAGGTPRASSVSRKISAAGFRTPTSSEKVR